MNSFFEVNHYAFGGVSVTTARAGRDAEQAFRDMKERYGLQDRCKKQRKRKVETRLKITDPW